MPPLHCRLAGGASGERLRSWLREIAEEGSLAALLYSRKGRDHMDSAVMEDPQALDEGFSRISVLDHARSGID